LHRKELPGPSGLADADPIVTPIPQ
jgi:hypothetical protein